MAILTAQSPTWIPSFSPRPKLHYSQCRHARLTTCRPAIRATTRRRISPHMHAKGAQRLQLVTVPDETHMATPGEVRHVSLDYSLFQTILQSGTTTFGMMSINDWLSHRGCILSILNIRNLSPDPSPRVQVECRCSGRFDVAIDSAPPPAWTLLSADCMPVSDWPVYEAIDRQNLAEAEWRVWKSCCQVADLMRKVTKSNQSVIVEQELAVWAPKEYDRKVTADEWAATPIAIRHTWCERAESFSFGVLRCMKATDNVLARARRLTSTLERMDLAMESVEVRRARTVAEISLRDAFS